MKKRYLILGTVSAVLLGAVTLKAWAYRGNPEQKGPNFSAERHEQMQKAFENKDYNAWKKLMNGRGRVSQTINESNFARFAEAHQLRLEGKNKEANKILAELGLGQGKRNRNNGKVKNGQRNFVDKNGDGICDYRQ